MQRVVLLVLFVLAGLLAGACEAAAAPPPGFVSLDRVGRGSRIELSLGTASYPRDPHWAHRFDVYAQFSGRSRVGGYFSVPLSVADGTAASGNAQAGGFFTTGGPVAFTVRGGLVFNTAQSDSFANQLAVVTRLNELVSVVADEPWLRFSVSPQWSRRRVFLRGDFGLDVPLPGSGQNGLARANFGLGFRVAPSIALTAEMVMVAALYEGRDVTAQRIAHTATFGVRGGAGNTTYFFGLPVMLLDAGPDPTFTVVAGLQYHF